MVTCGGVGVLVMYMGSRAWDYGSTLDKGGMCLLVILELCVERAQELNSDITFGVEIPLSRTHSL